MGIKNANVVAASLMPGSQGPGTRLHFKVRLGSVAAFAAVYDSGSNRASLTANFAGALSVDGTAVAVDDLVLLKDQATGSQNGIYQVEATGSATQKAVLRRVEALQHGDNVGGLLVLIQAGATLANKLYLCSDVSAIAGTNAITFVDAMSLALTEVVLRAVAATLTANLGVNAQKITNLGAPTADTDASTKKYVDDTKTGLDPKDSVRLLADNVADALQASTRAGNVITENANGALPTLDGIAGVVGNRIFFLRNGVGGAAHADDGIYTITSLGSAGSKWSFTRATDADSSAEVTAGMYAEVEEGTNYAGTGWYLATANPITLNTTALLFSQWTGPVNSNVALVSAIDVGDSAAAGTSAKVARADHQHALAAPAAPADVTKAAAATGASATVARADHKHDISTAAPAANSVGQAAAEGTATSVARSDHIHPPVTAQGIAVVASGTTTPAPGVLVSKTLVVDSAGDSDIVLVLPAATTWQIDDVVCEQTTVGNALDTWQVKKAAAAIGATVTFSATDGAMTRLGAVPNANKANNSFANGDTLRITTVDGSGGAGDLRARWTVLLRRLT